MTWTSAATHAVLPLLATDAGVRLQLETGIASHRRRFGAWHGGFWLPECAHAPWLDELLEEAGVHVTCVEWTDVTGPVPLAKRACVLVPLDRAAIDRVWHTSGYPSHGDYRDTHRLTPRAHQAWANDGTPYDPERGAARAREHAREFVDALDGHSVVAFDTELFGHFWHEGPTGSSASSSWRTSCRRGATPPSAAPDVAADELGPRARPAHLERDGAGVDAAPRRAGRARRTPVRRARCASCSRCRAPTGRS